MSIAISPNMSLPVPGVGTEAGPAWATDLDNCLTIIDQHTHAPGSGTLITPSAININTTLTFNNNIASNVASMILTTQGSSPSTSNSLYVKLGTEGTPLPDLFYFDGANQVQITSGGAINATAAAIPGESYSGGTFTWKQGAGSTVPANFDVGSVTVRPNTALTTNGVTLTPPSGIASAYSIALPPLPASQSFTTIDASGNMAVPVVYPLPAAGIANGAITTTQISGSAGIVGGQIAASTITGSNIATGTIADAKMVANTLTQASVNTSFINSGLYTPGIGSTNSNVAGYTFRPAQWLRVGNLVTVSHRVDVTLGGGAAFTISWFLPITSVFTAQWQVNGVGVDEGSTFYGVIQPLTTSQVTFSSPNTLTPGGTYFVHCHYSYQVL